VRRGFEFCDICRMNLKDVKLNSKNEISTLQKHTSLTCRRCQFSDYLHSMISCGSCLRTWHLYCLNPPMESFPDTVWFCASCCSNRTSSSLLQRRQMEWLRQAIDSSNSKSDPLERSYDAIPPSLLVPQRSNELSVQLLRLEAFRVSMNSTLSTRLTFEIGTRLKMFSDTDADLDSALPVSKKVQRMGSKVTGSMEKRAIDPVQRAQYSEMKKKAKTLKSLKKSGAITASDVDVLSAQGIDLNSGIHKSSKNSQLPLMKVMSLAAGGEMRVVGAALARRKARMKAESGGETDAATARAKNSSTMGSAKIESTAHAAAPSAKTEVMLDSVVALPGIGRLLVADEALKLSNDLGDKKREAFVQNDLNAAPKARKKKDGTSKNLETDQPSQVEGAFNSVVERKMTKIPAKRPRESSSGEASRIAKKSLSQRKPLTPAERLLREQQFRFEQQQRAEQAKLLQQHILSSEGAGLNKMGREQKTFGEEDEKSNQVKKTGAKRGRKPKVQNDETNSSIPHQTSAKLQHEHQQLLDFQRREHARRNELSERAEQQQKQQQLLAGQQMRAESEFLRDSDRLNERDRQSRMSPTHSGLPSHHCISERFNIEHQREIERRLFAERQQRLAETQTQLDDSRLRHAHLPGHDVFESKWMRRDEQQQPLGGISSWQPRGASEQQWTERQHHHPLTSYGDFQRMERERFQHRNVPSLSLVNPQHHPQSEYRYRDQQQPQRLDFELHQQSRFDRQSIPSVHQFGSGIPPARVSPGVIPSHPMQRSGTPTSLPPYDLTRSPSTSLPFSRLPNQSIPRPPSRGSGYS